MNFLVFTLSFLFVLTTVVLLLILIIKLFLFLIKRSEFPHKFARITLGCIVVSICLVMYRPLTFTFDKIDMINLQKSKTVSSPNLQYVATSLYEPYGGAAGGVNLIVYVTDTKSNEDKIIYYADAQNFIGINWLDNETLQVINKSSYNDYTTSLHVTNEIYHGNGYACSSLLMKSSYKNCYSNYNKKQKL